MTAPTDQLTRIARESQEAVTAALTTWTEAAERYAKSFDSKNPLPTVAEAQTCVDTAYDLAAKLLACQHAAATTVVTAGKEATERFTESARAFAPFPAA